MSNQNSKAEETICPQSKDEVKNQEVPLQGYPSAPHAPIVTNQPISIISPNVYQKLILEMNLYLYFLKEFSQDPTSTSNKDKFGFRPINWTTISLPVRAFSYPTGLEYLTTLDQLLVQQQVEMEGCKDLQSTNRFLIKNNSNQTIYFAIENSLYFSRICYPSAHPFIMKLFDNFGNEILHFRRSRCVCDCCCFFFCSQKMEVFSPGGTLLGVVQQESTLLYPSFDIKNSTGLTVLRLGTIIKKWRGFCTECTSDANNFEINFPRNLDIKMKAVVLAACFLIDVLFFEP